MSRDEAIERLLEAVSDRCDAQWDELERSASSGDERALMHNLRALRAIAEHGAPLSRAEAGDSTPRATWGHLTLLEKIGEGVYGEVHRAWDPKLAIDVALKLVPCTFLSTDDALREARLLARVRHEHVARVYGADRIGDHAGIWSEFVEGTTLRDVCRDEAPLAANRLLSIARQLLSALAAIHDAKVLHRDLKPENVLVDRSGRVVIADFGCGALRTRIGEAQRAEFAGTPRFLAPELFRGAEPSPSTDCYSIGVILFLLATGKYPTDADSPAQLQRSHESGERRRLAVERPDLPGAFAASVDRALEGDPARRFRSAHEWLEALDQPAPLAARPPRRTPGAVLAACAAIPLVALGVWWASQRHAGPISFQAELLRARGEGAFEGAASVRVGDRLMLEFESEREAHVYVLNWDDAGRAYLLFPMEGSELSNPLAAGQPHRLPGLVGGQPFAWEVSSAAAREHFAIVASAEELDELESALVETPRVQVESPGESVPGANALAGLLRGVGTAVSAEGTAGARGPEEIVGEWERRIAEDPELARRLAVRVVTVVNEGS